MHLRKLVRSAHENVKMQTTTLSCSCPSALVLQVNKPVPLISHFERLCNACIAGSFDVDKRSVKFEALDALRVRTVGLFGRNEDVLQVLHSEGAAHALPPGA